MSRSEGGPSPFRRLLRAQDDEFAVTGIPESMDRSSAAVLRSRLLTAATEAVRGVATGELTVTVTNRVAVDDDGLPTPATANGAVRAGDRTPDRDEDALSIADRASYFVATDPLYSFGQLVLPEEVLDRLQLAVETIELRALVFDTWNLRSIQPHPSAAINLYGNPGTGKTMAAHAIASRLGRKILCSKHSQLESKYHGEGSKNLDALFLAAQQQDAVLFLDEADSLMSRRFESVSQGSEQAVNSMRSELLMCLDNFEGLAIFATNFVQSYDSAFESRIRHVEIPDPDRAARREIWARHLPDELPRSPDVSLDGLAQVDDVTGREIRRAVIDAAVGVARDGRAEVGHADLVAALDAVKESRIPRPVPVDLQPREPGPEVAAAIDVAAAAVPVE